MHLRLQQYLPLISAVKIFAVSDNENLWLLRHVLGIPTVQTMVENRIRKFIGNFWMIRKNLLLYFSVMKFIMCFKCVLILVFFFVSPKIDHGSVAPFGDRDRRHCVGLWKNPDKKKPSKHLWCAISRIRGKETPWGIVTKFCMLVDIRDLIKFATFGDDRLGGLGVAGVEFPISPLTWVVALTTLSHYRASVWWVVTCTLLPSSVTVPEQKRAINETSMRRRCAT